MDPFEQRRRFRLLAVLALAATALRAAATELPVPPAGTVVEETFYGTVVRDEWRHLERSTEPRVVDWMQSEAVRARSVLDALPGREQLLVQMREIESGAPARVFSLERLPGEQYLYLKRKPNDNGLRLYKRNGASGNERVVVDLDPWVELTGQSQSFSFFASSPFGKRLAYGLSQSGAEASTMRVLDTRTLDDLIAPIDRTDLDSGESGDTGIGWLPDESGFFFNRLAPGSAGRSASERYKWSQVFLRRIGDPSGEERSIFGSESKSGIALTPSDVPVVFVPPDESLAIALVIHGTQREFSIYRSKLADVVADRPRWTKIFGPEAKITGMSLHDHTMYLLSHTDAPRFKVLRTRLDKPDVAHAATVYAPDRGILSAIASAYDALYLKVRDGMSSRLLRISHAGGRAEEVPLPAPGTFEMINPDGRIAGVLIRLEGWNRAYQFYRYDSKRRKWINDGLQPKGAHDTPVDIEVVEAAAKSHDGTMVPLSIVHRKGLSRDGRNPTLLQGYGAYGSTDEPAFDPTHLAWLRHGGVNAMCHARGGGVYGRAWYEAGKGATKSNTWKDGIACAEYLIANGYASPSTLAIFGGSAGGIFAGRAITERPDLFAVAVLQVGAMDMLRSEITATGSQNIPEFGSTATESGFRALYDMSAYHHVAAGIRYPAVLFIHGVNDARVDVWHSLKMIARMRAAAKGAIDPDPRPTLLRLDFDAGHGSGSTREQHWQELADMWSFILWQTGDPAFQPQ